MARLGSSEHPAVVRVRTMERAGEIMALCEDHGWKVIAGIEPDKPEDISDVSALLSQPTGTVATAKPDRNAPCPCGSGLKYKRCCWLKDRYL